MFPRLARGVQRVAPAIRSSIRPLARSAPALRAGFRAAPALPRVSAAVRVQREARPASLVKVNTRGFRTLVPRQGVISGQRHNSKWLALAGGVAIALAANFSMQASADGKQAAPELSPNEFRKFTLVDAFDYNHNTRVFRFAVTNPEMPITSYVLTRIMVDGKEVIRPYTPIAVGEDHFDLMIKVYPQGVMSNHIFKLQQNDQLEVKGPMAKLPYSPNMKKRIGMVAGGTGITPMLQVIAAVLENPEDKTDITLVFGNVASQDILLKEELDAMQEQFPNFHVHYIIDKPEPGWNGSTGYVTADLLKKVLPAPGPDSMVLVCGPPGFMQAVSGPKTKDYKQGELTGILKEIGFAEEGVFKF